MFLSKHEITNNNLIGKINPFICLLKLKKKILNIYHSLFPSYPPHLFSFFFFINPFILFLLFFSTHKPKTLNAYLWKLENIFVEDYNKRDGRGEPLFFWCHVSEFVPNTYGVNLVRNFMVFYGTKHYKEHN